MITHSRFSKAVSFAVVFLASFLCVLHGSEATARPRPVTRPGAAAGPTTISVGLWLIDIDNIDSAQQNFVASVFVGLRWKDRRLAFNGKERRKYGLDEVWDPRVLIVNEIGIVRKTLPEEVYVSPDGTVTYDQRYVGPFSQPLKLKEFPFDTHVFRLHLVAPGYGPDEIRFVPDRTLIDGGMKYAAGIAEEISLPDWDITGYETKELPYYVMPGYDVAGYALEFTARRHAQYYIWKIILPLVLIVLMSWSVFFIDPTNAGTKIGVATSAMLTLIAYRFVIDSQVPRVPYLTRLDIFIFSDTVLILSSLFMVTLTAYLVRIEKEGTARLIDQIWRLAFLLVFGFILLKTLFL